MYLPCTIFVIENKTPTIYFCFIHDMAQDTSSN